MTPPIDIRGLTKVFRKDFWGRKVTVLDDVTLEIAPNEIFGFVGPNGAGKTTTIKLCLGLLFPTRGEVRLLGHPNRSLRAKARVGFLPENPNFYDYLSGREFLDFYGQLFGLSRPERHKRADSLLDLVGLTDAGGLQLRKYSKGMVQRIGLAQALLNDPEVVILDEPMSGLDPIGRKDVRDIILHLKDEGKTVFFSTHILSDVEVVCDRVGILNRGRLMHVGRLEDMMTPTIHTGDIRARKIPADALAALPDVTTRTVLQADTLLITAASPAAAQAAVDAIQHAGGEIVAVTPHTESLEDYFLREVEGR